MGAGPRGAWSRLSRQQRRAIRLVAVAVAAVAVGAALSGGQSEPNPDYDAALTTVDRLDGFHESALAGEDVGETVTSPGGAIYRAAAAADPNGTCYLVRWRAGDPAQVQRGTVAASQPCRPASAAGLTVAGAGDWGDSLPPMERTAPWFWLVIVAVSAVVLWAFVQVTVEMLRGGLFTPPR